MRPVGFFLNHPIEIVKSGLLLFRDYLPDSLFLKLIFKDRVGYPLNLKSPKTYNEKLQWLKLYDRRPEYTIMVDKYAVKDLIMIIE